MPCVIAAIATASALGLLLGANTPGAFVASCLFWWVAVGAVVAWLWTRGGRQHFLAICFSLFFAFAFPTSGLVLMGIPDSADRLLPNDLPALSLSLLVGGLGWALFACGYLTSPGAIYEDRSTMGAAPVPDRAWSRLAVIAAAGIPFRVFVQLYSFSESGSDFSMLGSIPGLLADIGTICSAALWLVPNRRHRAAGLALIVLYSVTGAFNGQRAETFFPWVVFSIVAMLHSRSAARLRYRKVMVLFTLATVLVVSFPLLTRYKLLMSEQRGSVSGTQRIHAVRDAWSSALAETGPAVSFADNVQDSLVAISVRFSHLQYGANLVTRGLDAWGWLKGKSLVDSVIVFVPRFFWPDKPTIGLGEEAYHLMGYREVGWATVPVAADWYLNFGLVGVVFGMFLTGRFYAIVSGYLTEGEPVRVALAAYLAYHLVVAGMGISGIISTTLIISAAGTVILRAIRNPNTPARRRALPPVWQSSLSGPHTSLQAARNTGSPRGASA